MAEEVMIKAHLVSHVLCCFFLVLATTASLTRAGQSAPSGLEGKWVGTVDSIQGQGRASMTLKRSSGEGYTGTMTRLIGQGEIPLTDVSLDGDKMTAKSQVDAPQGKFDIKFSFVLSGDSLKGKGEVEFNGQTFEIKYDLNREGSAAANAAQAAQAKAGRPQMGGQVPQPHQKQGLDYFIGQWKYTWVGRDSELGRNDPSEGSITFTRTAPDRISGVNDSGAPSGLFWGVTAVGFDEGTKHLTFEEHRGKGLDMKTVGDWTTPISIRFDIPPLKADGHTVNLRRTISVISGYSFTVTEELSVDGGPFERLGQGTFAKVIPK
jgi:hypothetical protein